MDKREILHEQLDKILILKSNTKTSEEDKIKIRKELVSFLSLILGPKGWSLDKTIDL